MSVITHICIPDSFGVGLLVSGQVGDTVLLACNGFTIAEVFVQLTQRMPSEAAVPTSRSASHLSSDIKADKLGGQAGLVLPSKSWLGLEVVQRLKPSPW